MHTNTNTQDSMLTHYIEDIMKMGSDDKVMSDTLDALVKHMHDKGWGINIMKIQEIQWFGAVQISPPKLKAICYTENSYY